MDKTSSLKVSLDVFFGQIWECKVTVGEMAARSGKSCKAGKEFTMLIASGSRQLLVIKMCVCGGTLSAWKEHHGHFYSVQSNIVKDRE